MTFQRNQWDSFRSFLLIDRKHSDKPQAIQAEKSRFLKLADYFSTIEWSRNNFTHLLGQIKEKKYSTSYSNNLIKMGKLLDQFHGTEELKGFSQFPENRGPIRNPLSYDEILRLAKVLVPYKKDNNYLNQRQRVLIEFLGVTGARIDEALSATWNDLSDYPEPNVLFRDTKTNDNRVMFFSRELYSLMKVLPKRNKYIFCSYRGEKLYNQQINFDLKVRAKAVGIIGKPMNCHHFRRSYITAMLDEYGADWFSLAPLVGHKDPKTTMRYYLSSTKRIMQVARLHPSMKKEIGWQEKTKMLKEFVSKMFVDDRLSVEEENGKIVFRIED